MRRPSKYATEGVLPQKRSPDLPQVLQRPPRVDGLAVGVVVLAVGLASGFAALFLGGVFPGSAHARLLRRCRASEDEYDTFSMAAATDIFRSCGHEVPGAVLAREVASSRPGKAT